MRSKRLVPGALLLCTVACASVLGLTVAGPRPFEHRAHVMRGIACTECHADIRTAGDSGPHNLPGTDRCIACHASPHSKRECRTCHGLPYVPDRVVAAKANLRFSHELHLPSLDGNCARCHVGVKADDELLLPPMAACLSCHPHKDEWEVRDCAACHVDMKGEQVRPASHVVHDNDFTRSHGAEAAAQRDLCLSCHTESSCAGCHGVSVPALPERLSFASPGLAGVHRAGFVARHADEAKVEPGLCVTCHSTSSCASCHEAKGISASSLNPSNPHPPGWVSIGATGRNAHGVAARTDPLTCASCHGGAGEAMCVGCHLVGGVGGNIHPPGWTSPRDARRDVPCRACHGL